MNNQLIRLKEISKVLGFSTTTLRRMIKRKEIEAVKVGGNYYMRPNDYYKFLYNIECRKKGVDPEQARELVKKENEERNKELIKQMGLDKLDKNTLNLILSSIR